ncbi:MAG TPA: FGGY family carbohydrate kinase [Candidatus Methylomirabilis sp.]|nr:FGGY family carbohydrate kinase [Candidatus Methylomirabilis sp.]
MDTILTFDVGTSACKVCLWDQEGTLLASTDAAYPIHHPEPSWAEQDPEDWWRASVAAGRRCLEGQNPAHIRVIGLSSQREGVVPIGRDGNPLAHCIIWMDRRSRDQAIRLGEEFGIPFLHHHTGLAPDPNYTACKLLWLREHQPEILDRARAFLQPRDFLYYRLTGALVTDYTLASRTMMLDLRSRTWWPEIFRRLGVSPEQFPPIHQSIQAPYTLSRSAAIALGLPDGIPVSLGAGDRPCEAVGVELSGERVVDSTGTASNICMVMDRLPEDLGRAPCSIHAVPGRFLLELGITTSGSAIRWFRELLALPPEAVVTLEQEAAASPRGARDLVMFPFLMGARSVRWNADARGLLLGLSLGHTRGDIVRAIMEGVAYEVGKCLEGLRALGLKPGEVVGMGGGAKSDLWARIKADILALPILRPRHLEAASLGAALLAARSVDLIDNLDTAGRQWNPIHDVIAPDPDAVRFYDGRRLLFEELYNALVPLFPRLRT